MSEFINAINGPEVLEISYKIAEDWDALYEMIKLSNPEESEEQIRIIDEIRNGTRPLSDLDKSAFDLQETVANLLGNEAEVAA